VYLIKTGQFKETGEPVQFSGWLAEDGLTPLDGTTLVNGQGRPGAIAKTGVAQWLFVVDGLGPDVMAHLDSGKKRTFEDHMAINMEIPNARTIASITDLLYSLSDPVRRKELITGGRRTPVSNWDKEEFFWKNQGLITDSTFHSRRLRAAFRASEQAMGAVWVLVREKTAAEPEEVEDFFTRLASLGPTGVRVRGENIRVPALDATRRYLTTRVLNRPANMEAHRPTHQVAHLIKGWNFQQMDRDVEIISWRATGPRAEEFPDVL
jgi:hypothetical protein